MNRRLTIVLLGIIASLGATAASGDAVRDPAKLRLASTNVVVIDAASNRPVYTKGADAVTPIASRSTRSCLPKS